tara:strand:+ start:527 stop:901 length:375 start_codon:yes stop_codon:yes gene_type:complete
MNFNNLPSDIKQLIFNNNREHNNKINRDKKLREFWDEWEDAYEDDVEEFYNDGDISSPYWEDLTIKEKINIYKRHKRMMEIHESVMCDGSAPDWYYESLRSEDEGGSDKLTDPNYDRETGEYIN